jgi:hypothetical protein
MDQTLKFCNLADDLVHGAWTEKVTMFIPPILNIYIKRVLIVKVRAL